RGLGDVYMRQMEMGAMALFGEKYGDEVRVIKYGDSVELCGGTHVDNTGNIGMIKIIAESSTAAGIRRIEAVTGARAEAYVNDLENNLQAIAAMFNNVPDVLSAIRRSIDENADLRHQVEDYFNERVNNLSKQLIESAKVENGVKVVEMSGVRLADVVKNVAFAVRRQSAEHTAFIAATVDPSGKPLLTVMLTDDLVAGGLNASSIVRNAAKAIKGGGGGQPGFAQAGGKDADGISQALNLLREAIK
ncbi:MAG: alanine--tRNA ligase, partial [Muribaculaceae bacterium]|nr:alanine--tRNA ligase [Muribaculaceae bacterium]